MKITKSQLKQIIKEEIESVLTEYDSGFRLWVIPEGTNKKYYWSSDGLMLNPEEATCYTEEQVENVKNNIQAWRHLPEESKGVESCN